jgi:hypothetical protein
MINNKVSTGLSKLLNRKDVSHFRNSTKTIFSEIDRDNYFRHFELAQVAEIAEYGVYNRR